MNTCMLSEYQCICLILMGLYLYLTILMSPYLYLILMNPFLYLCILTSMNATFHLTVFPVNLLQSCACTRIHTLKCKFIMNQFEGVWELHLLDTFPRESLFCTCPKKTNSYLVLKRCVTWSKKWNRQKLR